MLAFQKMLKGKFQRRRSGIFKKTKSLIPVRIVSHQAQQSLSELVESNLCESEATESIQFGNSEMNVKSSGNSGTFKETFRTAVKLSSKIPVYCSRKFHRKNKEHHSTPKAKGHIKKSDHFEITTRPENKILKHEMVKGQMVLRDMENHCDNKGKIQLSNKEDKEKYISKSKFKCLMSFNSLPNLHVDTTFENDHQDLENVEFSDNSEKIFFSASEKNTNLTENKENTDCENRLKNDTTSAHGKSQDGDLKMKNLRDEGDKNCIQSLINDLYEFLNLSKDADDLEKKEEGNKNQCGPRLRQDALSKQEELSEDDVIVQFLPKLKENEDCSSHSDSERMTARECLKHPWLAKHRKSFPSAPVKMSTGRAESQEPRRASCTSCPEPRRAGCASCPPSSQSLRKYLSKSREALFERVLSQQRQLERQAPRDSLRRTTLLHQVNKTRRLCESQMSLVSKSRQKLIAEQKALMTHSREKLYGIKSLSKSHEVLNLYKSLVNLHDETLPDILKNLSDKVSPDNVSSVSSSLASVEYKPKLIADKSNGHKVHDENKENMNNGNGEGKKNGPSIQVGGKVASGPQSPTISSGTMESLEFNSTTDSDISEEDTSSTGRTTCSEEDEPRYTVKQLISAYNKHQEIVTKTSLEVTMSSDTQEKKMAQEESLNFPTGLNALRLFIPDIKITSRKKRMPRKKTGIKPPPNFDFKDENATDESTSGSKMDLSEINARLNEIASLPDLPSGGMSESLTSTSPSSSCTQTPTPTISPRPGLVSETLQIFQESCPPNRKSLTSIRPPLAESDKSRRKSSPPTMKLI